MLDYFAERVASERACKYEIQAGTTLSESSSWIGVSPVPENIIYRIQWNVSWSCRSFYKFTSRQSVTFVPLCLPKFPLYLLFHCGSSSQFRVQNSRCWIDSNILSFAKPRWREISNFIKSISFTAPR